MGRSSRTIAGVGLVFTSAVWIWTGILTANAQTVRAPRLGERLRPATVATESAKVRIRKFTALGGRNFVRTPEFRTSIARGINAPAEWTEILTTYDTQPDWLADLTFQFFVLSETTQDGRKVFSLFKTVIRYSDVKEGRNHLSSVFLHPKAIERFGQPVAAAVEILVDGTVVDFKSEQSRAMPESWWKNPQVVENKDVVARDGYLMDRSESPFALINIDDYEFVK